MTSAFVAIAGGALLAAPFLLYHLLRLPTYSAVKFRALFEKATSSHLLHRAGVPENTLAAIRRARLDGATGVEVDLTFTRDGQAVILHDSTVDRTCNGTGAIANLDFEQVRKLDCGCKYGSEFAGERIPTLTEVVDLCEQLDMVLFLELKTDPAKAVAAVQKVFAERPQLYERIAIISFYPNIIYKVRKADSKFIAGLVQRTDFFTHTEDGIRRPGWSQWWVLGAVTSLLQRLYNWSVNWWLLSFLGLRLLMSYKNDILRKKVDVEGWQRRGVSLVAWTVNKRMEKEHFQDILKIPFLTDAILPSNSTTTTARERTT